MFGRPTLKDLLVRYRDSVTPAKRGAESERARLNAMCRHPLARKRAHRVTPADIAAWRDERLRSVKNGTVRRDLGLLSHVFDVARREWGLAADNPVREVRWPPMPRNRERRLLAQFDEAERLLAACRAARNPLLLPIVELALETAMRRGELLALRWEHIDLAARTAILWETKTGHMRVVPLSSVAVRVLGTLGPRATGVVFDGLTGEAVKLAFRRATKRAGLVDFHFHDLRHEATTRLFEKGLGLMEVASITGHRDPRKLRGYTHLHAEALALKLG